MTLHQCLFYVIRRLLPARTVRVSRIPPLRGFRSVEAPCAVGGIFVNDTTFRFLNSRLDLKSDESDIDWFDHRSSKLWQYNLHYFDYLREQDRPEENKHRLIQSWIDHNLQGRKPGWEPFPTSLRIVNWAWYFQGKSQDEIPKSWLNSLYTQARWLEKNDERHILANHYFENLKALFVAGCLFDGKDGDRWVNRALREIPQQIREQTLADGGHYERSHQYHCLMLENYLDIYNWAQAYSGTVPSMFISTVRLAAQEGLRWLSATIFPDGTIPLFNDSAFDVSASPASLFDYADRLGIVGVSRDLHYPTIINCPESGYYGYRTGTDMLIMDCGDIGPHYQPGHTHCDFLSYELMINNSRVIVDTGVFDYSPGPMRQYVRSTKAHNTISVDGGEQSEIWGEFRVARRAERISTNIVATVSSIEITGAYRGFHKIRRLVTHARKMTIEVLSSRERLSRIDILDEVDGHGTHVIENYIHLHPNIRVRRRKNIIDLFENDSLVAAIQLASGQDYRIDSTFYCPEFGKQTPNQAIVVKTHGTLPIKQIYSVILVDFEK